MRTLKLTVAYDGSNYVGWQRQTNGLSIQQVLEEAFAPLVGLYRFSDFEDALRAVNASRYGLQAGVFTGSLEHAWLAFDRLDVGGVIVNDVPSFRIDHMPYGGVKDSGLGREGPRQAIEDMTEPRLLVIARRAR